jgi:hypothetical protein
VAPLPGHHVALLADQEAVQIQEHEARYPELLFGPWDREDGVLYRRFRAGPKLVAVAVLHGALRPAQRRLLGGFRLRQYALCGLYDVRQVVRNAEGVDPSLEALSDAAVHIIVGTPDGRLLAYMCMETAQNPQPDGWASPHDVLGIDEPNHDGGVDPAAILRAQSSGLDGVTIDATLTMGAPGRPLFPTESELFGPAIFPSLPALLALAVTEIREMTRMLRNQAMQSPQSIAATVEVVYVIWRLLCHPALDIKAMLGCLDRDGRAMLAHLGMPMLYAPTAPVLAQQVALSKASLAASLWTDVANAQGRFWPFVFAAEDVRRHAAYFKRLDKLLSLKAGELRRALVEFRRQRPTIVPEALMPGAETSSILWTTDPFYSAASRVQSIPDGSDGTRSTVPKDVGPSAVPRNEVEDDA